MPDEALPPLRRHFMPSKTRPSKIEPIVGDGGDRRRHSRAHPSPRVRDRGQPSNRATPPQLLTVAEAAEILSTSDKTVRRRIKGGELRAIKDGHLVRIDPRDLEDFIRDRRTR